ncbi:MAG TPA: glycerol-3-phosphate responsive antiterminator [Firmicutes bacterium]|nr:glycerol-3-phosphate responsive antiterminator [Bacillota bacterium]
MAREPQPLKREFRLQLRKTRIIPGVKGPQELKHALEVRAPIIFLLTGSIFDLSAAVAETKAVGSILFAHADLLQGIGKDAEGMRYLAKVLGVQGILTTRKQLIKEAQQVGLLTVQRVFAVDSEALRTGFDVVRSAGPDAFEVLPALALPSIAHRLPFATLPPVIAGGLLETEEEVEMVLRTPVKAVSTSKKALWARHGR